MRLQNTPPGDGKRRSTVCSDTAFSDLTDWAYLSKLVRYHYGTQTPGVSTSSRVKFTNHCPKWWRSEGVDLAGENPQVSNQQVECRCNVSEKWNARELHHATSWTTSPIYSKPVTHLFHVHVYASCMSTPVYHKKHYQIYCIISTYIP